MVGTQPGLAFDSRQIGPLPGHPPFVPTIGLSDLPAPEVFVMPTLCAPVKERRAFTRTPENVRILVNDPEDALNEPYPATVVDHSPGGVRLAFDSSTLQVGNELSLQPACAVFPVEVRVKNRRRREGRV